MTLALKAAPEENHVTGLCCRVMEKGERVRWEKGGKEKEGKEKGGTEKRG